MHERRRVKQFESHGSVQSNVGHMSERLRHEQYEHRTHALSGAPPYVFERAPEHAVLMRQRTVEQFNEIGKFCLYRLFDD